MSLRDYQKQALAETWQHYREGRKSVLIQLATGAGKTKTAVYGCKVLAAAGKRVWWITHRRELIRQTSKAFREAEVYHGIIANGTTPNPRCNVQVASIGTIRNRVDKLAPPDIIVWDETRHLKARTWRELFLRFPDARHLGLDATPRVKSGGLGEFYEVCVHGPSIGWLMDEGYLCRYRLFTPPSPDLSGVHHVAGEFKQSELNEVMDKPTIVGSAVEQYTKHAPGVKALLFAVSVEASKHAAAQFCAAGYRFIHIDGDTDPIERDNGIKAFERGELDGVCNVGLFTEGTDIKGVRCIIDLAPTESLPRYLQMYGRGLRADDVPCIFLCHSGNFTRHGYVDDDRDWPLESEEKNRKPPDVSNSRECPKCYARFRSHMSVCPECSHAFPVQSRTVAEVQGELVEVDLNNRERVELSPERKAQAMAKSVDDLMALGHSEGRAKHIIEAREEKENLRNLVMDLAYDTFYETGNDEYRPTRKEVWDMKPKALRENIEQLTEALNAARAAKETASVP